MPRSIQTAKEYVAEKAKWEAYQEAQLNGVPSFESPGSSPRPPERPDDYSDRLAKYIPTEVVTLYLALIAATAQAVGNPNSIQWLAKHLGEDWPFWLNLTAFLAGIVTTPLYLRYRLGVSSMVHTLICMGSFVVWAVAIPDGLFKDWPPIIRGFLLPFYTFAIAFYEPPPAKGAGGT